MLQTKFSIVVKEGKQLGPYLPKIERLLYQVFVKEGGWKFGANTPSGLRIINVCKDETKRCTNPQDSSKSSGLTDAFMDSSTWAIGITSHKEVVGCIRLIHKRNIELAGYAHRSKALSTILERYGPAGLIEMNRLAVHPSYRGATLYQDIFKSIMKCYEDKSLQRVSDEFSHKYPCKVRPLVGTVPINIPYQKGMQKFGEKSLVKVGEPFFYEDSDPYPAQLYIYS